MGTTRRICLAAGIVAVDLLIFFLPLSAIFLAYVIMFNPPWVRAFLDGLKAPGA